MAPEPGKRRLALLAAGAAVGIVFVALIGRGGDDTKGTGDRASGGKEPTSGTTERDGDGVTASSSSSSTTAGRTAGVLVPGASAVSLKGIGPVTVGMTLPEASQAAGARLVAEPGLPDPDHNCGFVRIKNGPKGLAFMLTRKKGDKASTVARVDVEAAGFKTRSGRGVGDTEEEVKAAYPGRITVEPHEYVKGGHYLEYQAQDPADAAYGLVFETDGKKVTSFRAGRRPEVEYVERCS